MQLVPTSHWYICNLHQDSLPDILPEDATIRDFADSTFEVYLGTYRYSSVVAAPLAFSPSGRLLCDSTHGPRAMDALMDSDNDDLVWSMSGEPGSSVELDQHPQVKKSNRCVGWLPSGWGFVYESCNKEKEQTRHIFMFA